MSKIPTAEELFKKHCGLYSFEEGDSEYLIDRETFIEVLKESNLLHVRAALEAAAKNVRTTCLADKFLDAYDPSKDAEGDVFTKDSILNAYPEILIQ